MEKKNYILIGALILVGLAILILNVFNFGGEKTELNFGVKSLKADLPQKQVSSSQNAETQYAEVKLLTICSS